MSEETKFQAISIWLDAGRRGFDAVEITEAFTKMISKINLPKLSSSGSEIWKFVSKYSKLVAAGDTSPSPGIKSDGNAIKEAPQPSSNCLSRCKYIDHFC
ncbi:hypothetical protein EGR_10481 [Echinococcus granulosus]|uniref:Uncharacterized protein n=1 Tax=Echinococcus granulosus TaxID=6210 RepID=W6U0U2_ECHGR|nr:hypothetical protein EGR_10481 [Echinococcus granulosus]EUB54663.1 hypothetical protein EGR_10481 [Echinococcus granulosus]